MKKQISPNFSSSVSLSFLSGRRCVVGSFGFVVSDITWGFLFSFVSSMSWVSVVVLLAIRGDVIARSVSSGAVCCSVCFFRAAFAVTYSTVRCWGSGNFLWCVWRVHALSAPGVVVGRLSSLILSLSLTSLISMVLLYMWVKYGLM